MYECDRYPRPVTRAAIDALCGRFGLSVGPGDQDWEYTAADASRLGEFLAAMESGGLSDDERFTLSERVMQCFDDSLGGDAPPAEPPDWPRFAALLRARPALHAHTLSYWSSPESEPDDAFAVSRLVRPLWAELKPRADAASAEPGRSS